MERPHKKAPPLPKAKPKRTPAASLDLEHEIFMAQKRQQQGWAYLERQFAKAIKEEGNTSEVRQLLKAFEQREESLRKAQEALDVRRGLASESERRSRYRLDSVDAEESC